MESSLSYHGDLEKEVEDVQSGNGDERKCLPVFASWRSLWQGCDDGWHEQEEKEGDEEANAGACAGGEGD